MSKAEYIDTAWDFRNADTKTHTHCYHSYPAMMIPQIAHRLIKTYGSKAKMLFDPYCGTGTSLVEANLQGIDAIGTDLNPLARLIARTKTAKINLQILDMYLKEFSDFCFSLNFGVLKPSVIMPEFHNIDFWFAESVKKKLSILKQFIDKITDDYVRDFFYVAFSETVRDCSFTRNSEFKLYRMAEKKREMFNPNAFDIILQKLARNRKGLLEYLAELKDKKNKACVYSFNTVEGIEEIAVDSIDLVVTSPPYGDSRTTVAYGQFSRLANQWLGFEGASQVDNSLMGGKRAKLKNLGIRKVDKAIGKVALKDEKRAMDVFSFYYDYFRSIQNVSLVMRKSSYACYVVGNRKVKDTVLPTDEITKLFFVEFGFEHIDTIVRNIPNKRMPSKNSPTNERGVKNDTMNKEYIVIMKKL